MLNSFKYSLLETETRVRQLLTPEQYAQFCNYRTVINRHARVAFAISGNNHRYMMGIGRLFLHMVVGYMIGGHYDSRSATRLAFTRLGNIADYVPFAEDKACFQCGSAHVFTYLK